MVGLELLTCVEMAEADRLAAASGVSGLTLMENAGRAVAEAARGLVGPGDKVLVLAGPGNNGGDGFVAARHLLAASSDVTLCLLGDVGKLEGDAADMARRWTGRIAAFDPTALGGVHLVIDALFGAGLTRALDGAAAAMVEAVNASGMPVIAVDVPSGLDGTTGKALGATMQARRTVTFFRRKPGHLLMPGRMLCGETIVADIGIPSTVLESIQPRAFADAPTLWLHQFPWPRLDAHKYTRGHAVVVSGPAHATGAARLGARGALRAGAGLVTVVGSAAATAVNAAHLTAVMTRIAGSDRALAEFLEDKRRNAVLIGPGMGLGRETAESVLTVLASQAGVVIDADGLTSFAPREAADESESALGFTAARSSKECAPETLFRVLRGRRAPAILTPHDGEFARLFPDLSGSKLDRARAAAERCNAVVVLKGPDTVVAAPDGRAAINENAPPWLATAGSGDVLAGFVAGLVAQRMPAFEAACAAVWLHGECAGAAGPGLIAEDLPERLPDILYGLHQGAGRPHWDASRSNAGLG